MAPTLKIISTTLSTDGRLTVEVLRNGKRHTLTARKPTASMYVVAAPDTKTYGCACALRSDGTAASWLAHHPDHAALDVDNMLPVARDLGKLLG